MAATPIAMGSERLGAVVVASQRDDLAAWAPFLDAIAVHIALAVRLAHTVDRLAGSERVAHARTQHDALTGMPNERVVVERLAAAVDERGGSGAVLYVGIDRFRYLNAHFGYRSGDMVLQSLASRLSARVGTDVTIGRSGGDRFIVLAPPPHHGQNEALDLAARLLAWIAEPLACEGAEHRLTASAGVVLFPAHGVDPSTLLWRADSAMRRAKDTGGGCVALFDPEWDPQASQRLVIDHELRSALGGGGGGLHLHYQPRLSLPSLRLTGAEALLRWDHVELGRLSPSAVVAVAEESGLMPQLGMWVLDAACAQIRAWDSLADARPPRVAVNVAAQQLLNDDLADDVARVLRRWKLPGDVLELEITETAAIQNLRRSVALLTEIRSMGVSIALDDFGTGYSSLAHLRRLPLDSVKIDQSFIRELPRDESNQAVVTAIIELAHRLGLTVVAEGVEMQSQLDHLIRGGCDEAQGWLFAPALPADEFVRLHCSATPSAGSS